MTDEEILYILKVAVMVIFFIIVVVFGTLPLRSKGFKQRPLLRTMGATFAGCLFLNVALLHILPEAADNLQQYMKGDDKDKDVFPLAYLLMMVGFIITVFFTKVMSFHTHQQDEAQFQQVDSQTSIDTNTSPKKKRKEVGQNLQGENIKQSLISNEDQQNSKKRKIKKFKSTPAISKTQQSQSGMLIRPQQVKIIEKNKSEQNAHNHGHSHDHSHDHDHDHRHEHNHSTHHHHHHVLKNPSMLNQAFILTIAIYFHTIFEGIAIGVQDNITGFLGTAVAIAFHKWADALSMGCHYRNKNVKKKLSYSLIIGQAILNVISIGAGWLISQQGPVLQAIFLSLSAGTFLAISTMEMLGQQFHHKEFMKIKFALLFFSTAFVSSIWFVENSIFNQN